MAKIEGVLLDTSRKNEEEERKHAADDKAWYVVNTYSTHEKKVQQNLLRRIESMNLNDFIFRVIVAEQEVPVMHDGLPTGKTRMKNLFPGYVFVEMCMTDFAWYVVRNTPGVTGFVGSSGKGTKPFPVPKEQIEPILKRMGMVDDSMYEHYAEGDLVRIIHGPFEGTEGKILSIDKEAGMVVVEATFFGKASNFDVEFSNIDKI